MESLARQTRSFSVRSMSTHALSHVYEHAKQANYHLQIAAQVYTKGARLPLKTERKYMFDLIAAGQPDRAIKLWKNTKSQDSEKYWNSTGVLLYCKLGNITMAEELARKGVYSYAESEIAKAHAHHKNVSEALGWLKSCNSRQRRPVMELLATDSLFGQGKDTAKALMNRRSKVFSDPGQLASTLSKHPDLLDDKSSVLKALSASKEPIVDDAFWRKNHEPEVRFELLKQGVSPSNDTPLVVECYQTLLDRAISTRDHEMADKIFATKPSGASARDLQFALRYHFFKGDYATAFDYIASTPVLKLNMNHWKLIWNIIRSFDSSKYPKVVLPDIRDLYQKMMRSHGIPTNSQTLNAVISCFEKAKDYGYMLGLLNHWKRVSGYNLPRQTLQYVASRCNTTPRTIKDLSTDELVKAMCTANGEDFANFKEESPRL